MSGGKSTQGFLFLFFVFVFCFLCFVFCVLCFVFCFLFCVFCFLFFVFCVLCFVFCFLFFVFCFLFFVFCFLFLFFSTEKTKNKTKKMKLKNKKKFRFVYCAVNCLSLLKRLDAINISKAVEYVVGCKNFDGAFGCTRQAESHGGQSEGKIQKGKKSNL